VRDGTTGGADRRAGLGFTTVGDLPSNSPVAGLYESATSSER
jgi:hypothetical protein